MTMEDRLRDIAERVRNHSSSMATEEAVKTAVVLPFLSALGYEVFNPAEVIPEFTADAVGKKGERVDYAIRIDGQLRILIECKPITCKLERVHLAQLYRYFSVTEAKFAVLTNGRTFHFHTDLDAPNRLDPLPFLSFDFSELNPAVMSELKKFARDGFDVDGVLQSATRLKYTSAIKQKIGAIMDDPPEDFVRMVVTDLHEGRFTAAARDLYTPLVKSAFRELLLQAIQNRLTSVLEASEPQPDVVPVDDEPDKIVTTEEEREGFLIVRAIARETIPASRIFLRDQQTYCGILIDNNNRRPLARLWLNRSVKYLSLFDGEKEERVRIETLDHIYDYTDRLRETARRYL